MFYSFDIFSIISRLDFFKFFKKFNNINPREEINFFSTIIVFTITNQAIIPLWNTGQSDFLLLGGKKKKIIRKRRGKNCGKRIKLLHLPSVSSTSPSVPSLLCLSQITWISNENAKSSCKLSNRERHRTRGQTANFKNHFTTRDSLSAC